ncbi:OmpA family protein [Planomonospora corallina]|uniref:OmpA family protein n=1 Tax=Planomonospora corallina TaxID=1806052 RepID=A0ABV8ID64_9ACTN
MRTALLTPLIALVLASCAATATGGDGESHRSPAPPSRTAAPAATAPQGAAATSGSSAAASGGSAVPATTGPEPTSCPNGTLIPAVEVPAVHADPVVIPEARIGGETIPSVTIPGVDIPATRIPAQCTEIAPAPGGCLGAASIPPVSIPAVEIPPVEIPGVDAGGIKLDPVRAEGVRAEAVHAQGVSTPEVCQVVPEGGGRVPYVRRDYIRRDYIRRDYIRRDYIRRPGACNEQRECIPAVEVPAVEVRAVEVRAVEIPAAELKAYEIGESEVLEGGGSIAFAVKADVLFDFDSAAIKPEAAAELRRVARQITEKAASGAAVQVDGHTDARGDDAHNQTLSERRARAVADWLATEGGVPRARLEARGYGETKPVTPNTKADGSDDPAGRAKNRRVVISTTT